MVDLHNVGTFNADTRFKVVEKDNSGFGWDEHRQLVIAEDVVWNSYISSHKKGQSIQTSQFPLL
ncbi:hypothetical protein Goklo_012584 [Gossypium klotzschianum]|uniref:Myb/SANT-like domain-containing protein n=1 Tax=Gossypium klotzschianum TaxID=34286 RepID=A0A7J8VDQ4_9ROSI|nr:hypothetical protein [Gossypium klotzschianum]